MPFVIISDEQFALPIGETLIGGVEDESLPVAGLQSRAPFALIEVTAEGTASIRRIGLGVVTVNGQLLGDTPRTLEHGMKLGLAGIAASYGDIRHSGRTTPIKGLPQSGIPGLGDFAPSVPTADSGGRVKRRNGDVIAVPNDGLVIGRDPRAGLVLRSRGVSRRHALIEPSLQGYTLNDLSSNGVLLNGRLVAGAEVLGMGDVVTIGDEELVFEADPPPLLPEIPREPIADGSKREPARPAAAGPLLATLEVLNEGAWKGERFRIERPVVNIGRSQQNDISFRDESVSGTHASLSRRATGWFLLDVGSTNGTYVDGARVSQEVRLPGACELRFGNIKVVFRPIAGASADEGSTRVIVGLPEDPSR